MPCMCKSPTTAEINSDGSFDSLSSGKQVEYTWLNSMETNPALNVPFRGYVSDVKME